MHFPDNGDVIRGGGYPTRLENVAQEAAFKLKRSKEYLTSASILLAECKRRVDAGDPDAEGASWAGYCRVHFLGYSLSQIGRLIDLIWQADHPDDETAFDRAWSAFVALGRKQQHEFLRRGTGQVVRSDDARGRSVSRPAADPPSAIDRLA